MTVSPQVLPSSLPPSSSVESTSRHAGWAMALRGVLAVIFGIIALRSPNVAASVFVLVFAVYSFADGIVNFALAGRFGRAGRRWGWYLFEGIVDVALGVVALAYPGVTLLAIIFLVGLRAIMLGIFELVAAFSWEGLDSRWMLGITGVLSILLGILLLASPAAGGLALLWTIGVYAIVFGVMIFALGLRLLSAERGQAQLREPAPTPS